MTPGRLLVILFALSFPVHSLFAQLVVSADTTICEGSAVLSVLEEPLHATGDYTLESIPFTSETHAGTNFVKCLGSTNDDASSCAIDIGFTFCFFGNSYDEVYIATNGWISFTNPPASNVWNTVYGPGGTPTYTLPNTNVNVPKNCIMGPWQDWDLSGCASCLKYQTLGTAPYRRFVVSYKDMQLYSCGATAGDFQIIIYETTNLIQTNIIDKPNCMGWENGKATQAIHNSTGTVSVEAPGRDATAWTTTNESWLYTPAVVEWYDGGTFIGDGSEITVSPTSTTTYTATVEACDGTTYTDVVTVFVAPDDATFTYPAGFPGYCASGTLTPTYIATPGGSFSATPSDLIIDATTGVIDLSAAPPGSTYTIKYVLPAGPCQDSSSFILNILNWDDSSFTYAADTYCPEGFAAPDYIATPGGNFSASPAGLIINPLTGNIDLSTGTVGTTYTVTYVTPGDCPTTATFDVTIDPLDDPSFSYDAADYCPSGTSIPSITTPGGSFTISPSSMDIDALTGEVDLSTGISGTTYTITYSTPFPCVATETQTIFIDPLDDASFAYDAASYCPTGTTAPVYITTPGGSFTVMPAGLVVDPVTGEADLSTGTIGTTYAITYTTPAGPCQNSGTETILIDPLDDPGFNYTDTEFCPFGSALPAFIATPGGTFTITPADATIISSTGAVDLTSGTPGTTYTITYTTPAGPCQNISSVSLTIMPVTDANFSYYPAVYCNTGTTSPSSVDYPGGTFTAAAGIVINSATGEIDLGASSAGVFNIYYTSPGCGETDTFSVTINALPVLTIECDDIVCLEGDPLIITVTPDSGMISGTAVADNIFDPALAGSAGMYDISYSYTDANGCTATATKTIEVISNSVNAGPDVSIFEQGSITLHADGGVTFLWTPDYELSCTGCAAPVASPFETTTYTVTSYDAYGCVASDEVTVTVIPVFDSTVFVPNTFTPNGDGLNDYLTAFGSDIILIRYFSIYDRWGELLWRADNIPPADLRTGWDGTSKGMQVENGVYAFIVEVELNNGANIMKKGNVTILR